MLLKKNSLLINSPKCILIKDFIEEGESIKITFHYKKYDSPLYMTRYNRKKFEEISNKTIFRKMKKIIEENN